MSAETCGQRDCGERATSSYVWPGRGRLLICGKCIGKLVKVAEAFGLSQEAIALTPLTEVELADDVPLQTLGLVLARIELAVDALADDGKFESIVKARAAIADAWRIVASQRLDRAVDLTGVPYTLESSEQAGLRASYLERQKR